MASVLPGMATNITTIREGFAGGQFVSPLINVNFDSLDIGIPVLCLLGLLTYFLLGNKKVSKFGEPKSDSTKANSVANSNDDSRNIVSVLAKKEKNCVVFYGSQTGTAEDYASSLVKEGASRFGLKTMSADLEEFDHEHLSKLPSNVLAIFVMATYGEGDPTDNAMDFWNLITSDEPSFSDDADISQPLAQLRYVTFGLGNKNYEKYNAVAIGVDAALERLGATRIASIGLGDDAAGSTEEDFLVWKEQMWSAAANLMGLTESTVAAEPIFQITETESCNSDDIYFGELSKEHLEADAAVPYSSSNPYAASIVHTKHLISNSSRKCIHVEIDLQQSGLTYTTGDHLAVWPTNAEQEVSRFLSTFGLSSKANQVIKIQPVDSTAKVSFPSPTTYGTAARHYLEICGPVSRPFLAKLATFAPSSAAKSEMEKLGSDKDYFHQHVLQRRLNLAQVCEIVASGLTWSNVPFAILIEDLNRLKPRYYSISSSSLAQNSQLSVTVMVDEADFGSHAFKGVASNYLFGLSQEKNGVGSGSHELSGPRNRYQGARVPIHLRTSTFRLPQDPRVPIIMVGPGTGVAPFRAFLQERAAQAKSGVKVGKTLLFFGCRNEQEDFLYADEWKQYEEALGGQFELITAFSRQGPSKVYVQHRLMDRAADVGALLVEQNAHIYVCGDAASMAGDVRKAFTQIIAQAQRSGSTNATEVIAAMKGGRRYQEDIW